LSGDVESVVQRSGLSGKVLINVNLLEQSVKFFCYFAWWLARKRNSDQALCFTVLATIHRDGRSTSVQDRTTRLDSKLISKQFSGINFELQGLTIIFVCASLISPPLGEERLVHIGHCLVVQIVDSTHSLTR
jgi:hypothetical protein